MRPIVLRSPAKINLILKVINKRPDGYHNLKTVFERVDLFDELTFTPRADGKIHITCDHPQVPTGPKNLVYRVGQTFQRQFGVKAGADIHIRKRIPVAAGLAGGSGNGATALLGLNRIWGLKLSLPQLVEHGRRIGSDVPFFLYDCPWALGTERGDRIRPLDVRTRLWQVLAVPRLKMYSREVFTRLNLGLTKKDDNVNILLHSLRKNDLDKLGMLLCNDLEPSILAIRPGLSRVKQRFGRLPLKGVAFSGSGPAVFGIAAGRQEAEQAAGILRRHYRQVFVVRTL